MAAVRNRHKAAAEWLLQQGVAVDACDSHGFTALHTAQSKGSDAAAMIELLLANGADVHKCCEGDQTALSMAVYCGNVESAKVLIAAGSDVHHVCKGVNTLHIAVTMNHSAIVQLLLEHGATAVINRVVQVTCSNGVQCCTHATALTLCTTTVTLKVLLAAGADAKAVLKRGDTALHVAARHNYPVPVVCLLIKAGAAISATNLASKTAAQVAHDRGDTLLEKLLVRAAAQQKQGH
jgi:ankyrin repeat protein